jgi:hypothetical protein
MADHRLQIRFLSVNGASGAQQALECGDSSSWNRRQNHNLKISANTISFIFRGEIINVDTVHDVHKMKVRMPYVMLEIDGQVFSILKT